jgi:hypothetical protein
VNLKAAMVRALNRHVLPRWQLVLRKSGHGDDDQMLTPKYRDIMVADVSALLAPYLMRVGLLPATDGAALEALVREFLALHQTRPVRDNTGGTGLNGSLCLFAIARLLAPLLVVESGTWQGHSAWLLAKACPGAEIHSFDIEQDNLLHREPGVSYHLGDWTKSAIAAKDPLRSLCFFDDHVSHARRIGEAYARGFRRLLLDDDLPAPALFVTGLPPAPTAAMLMDDRVQAGEPIEWRYRGKTRSFQAQPDERSARDLIAAYHPAPDLAPATHYHRHNGISLLRLRD